MKNLSSVPELEMRIRLHLAARLIPLKTWNGMVEALLFVGAARGMGIPDPHNIDYQVRDGMGALLTKELRKELEAADVAPCLSSIVDHDAPKVKYAGLTDAAL